MSLTPDGTVGSRATGPDGTEERCARMIETNCRDLSAALLGPVQWGLEQVERLLETRPILGIRQSPSESGEAPGTGPAERSPRAVARE
jgi:hypothetical protein